MVDHTENTRARTDFAENSLAECSPRAPSLLNSALRPQLYFLDWLVRRGVGSIAGLILIIVLGAGFFFLYLGKGPIVIAGLGPRITQALDQKIGHGYAFKLGAISVKAGSFGPTLAIDHLSLTSSSGEPIITAPHAEVSVDLIALAFGKIVPKRLEVYDIEVHLALLPDGSLAVSAGNGQQGVLHLLGPLTAAMGGPHVAPAAPAGRPPALAGRTPPHSLIVKRIAAAMRLLIDVSTRPNGPLAAIDRIGIARGRFVIEDQLNDQTKIYNGLDLSLDKSGGGTNLDLSAQGPSGPWSVSARASGNPGGSRRLDVEFKNISLDEISLVSGLRNFGADFDMPISSKFAMVLDADRKLAQVSGHIHFDPGYLRFEDPNDEPRMIDSIDAGFHWDRAGRRIVLDDARLQAGQTNFAVAGAIAPPVREGEPWTLNLASSRPGVFGPERPGEGPIAIDHIGLQGRLALGDKTFYIDRFEFNGPNCGLAMAGSIDWKHGPHVRLGASISPTPAVIAVRLWPSFMAADIRAWFLAHWKAGVIERGTMQVDFNAAMIDAMRHQYAPPDSAVSIDFALSDGAVEFLPGVPLLRGIDGVGHVTGHTSTFLATRGNMDLGRAGKLTMSDGVFHIAHAEIKPTLTELSAKVSGDVTAVGDLLNRDALKPYASLPVDPSTLRGEIAGDLGITLRLGPGAHRADTKLRVNAVATDFSAEKLFGDAKLEAATLNVVVDDHGLKASGPGMIFGAPADVDLTMPAGSHVGQAVISLVADDALRAKQGLAMFPGVTGPIATRVTVPLGAAGPLKAQVDLDLTHAAIDSLGISKPAGRSGKASFALTVNDDHSISLDDVEIDAAPVEARGSVTIGGADPTQISAKFSQMKLSAGDNMKLDASKVGDTLKLVIRATTLDARPFLKTLTLEHAEETDEGDAHKESKDATAELAGANLDVDLKAAALNGFNKQTMSNVDLHFVKNKDALRQFALVGKFGSGTIYGNLDNAGTPAPQLDLSTNDAGALLAFIDLYRHMDGGQLAVSLRLGEDAMAGKLAIRNFVLRDEPALRRLVAEGTAQTSGAHDFDQSIDFNAVQFTRLQVNFQRAGTRLDLHDGTIYGPQIGLTADGWLDFARDRVSLDGTFVPAYGVNNLVSQIPIFGLLLGGGLHEGLFAVNYRITGAATKPVLNVNLLTAIAPGILRKIFGATTDLVEPDAPPPESPTDQSQQ
ncbi:MAG: AsmA-like C-terminal region-containing protein [Methylovirgula sp.]